MTLPTIPTDNIYKFIALTGVFVFLFGLIYPEIKKDEISKDQILIDGDKMMLDHDNEEIKDKQKELGKEIQTLHEKCKCGPAPIISDTSITWFSLTSGPQELLKISRGIDTLVKQWKTLQRKYGEKQIDIITKLSLQIQKHEQLNKYKQLQENIVAISALISLIGFMLWYERTQRFQDRILKFQHDDYITTQLCQSCGIWLKNLDWFNELSEGEKRKIHYCKTCYNNGAYVEPELSFEQMKQRVKKQCKQLGFNKIQTYFYLRRLRDLGRWTKKFKW